MCEDPRVRIQGRPDERWLGPIVRACDELRTLPDGDATARVRIVPSDGELIVEVVLQDGRSTLRRVRQPEALRPTLEALVTVPPPIPVVPPRALPTRALAPAPAPPALDTRAPPLPAAPALNVSVELGGAVGGRVAGAQGYLSVGPAGFAQVRVGDWLLGMSARWEVFQYKSAIPGTDFEMDTVATGISVARRLRASFADVDIGMSPRLLAETQSFLTSTNEEHADTQTDLRFAAFTRAAIGHGPLRLFLEIDGEFSPARLRRDIRIDPVLPALPAWSAGLAVGAAWGPP